MQKIVFEAAALADTLKKANRIAPTKGRNLESYAGFMLEVNPADMEIVLRSTDGGVFYMEWITPLEIDAEAPFNWRIPSAVTTSIINAMPQGAGSRVTFTRDGGKIAITSKRTRASIRLIPEDNYPLWETFDPDAVSAVQNLGARLDQVAWAVSKKDVETVSGVYMDGENIIATNKQRLAVAPFAMPISAPVVVPMAVLAPVIGEMREMRAGIVGNYLCLLPNDYTQIKCILMADDFPDVSRVMTKETTDTIIFNREIVVALIQRIMTVGSKDRQSYLDLTIGNEEMILFTQDEGADETIEDAIELTGMALHEPVRIRVGPENFMYAISKAPGMMIAMNYDHTKPLGFIRFEAESDYRVWIPPRRQVVNDPQGAAS